MLRATGSEHSNGHWSVQAYRPAKPDAVMPALGQG